MNKFNIEEVKAMSPEEQIAELEKQIQRVKDTREKNDENIRLLEGMNENYNQQLETLIELKWSCKFQQRMNEVGEMLMGDNDNNPDNEWKTSPTGKKKDDLLTKGKRRIAKTIEPLRKGFETWSDPSNFKV